MRAEHIDGTEWRVMDDAGGQWEVSVPAAENTAERAIAAVAELFDGQPVQS